MQYIHVDRSSFPRKFGAFNLVRIRSRIPSEVAQSVKLPQTATLFSEFSLRKTKDIGGT